MWSAFPRVMASGSFRSTPGEWRIKVLECGYAWVLSSAQAASMDISHLVRSLMGFPGSSDSKESVCNTGDLGLLLGLRRSPWRREWLPISVFLPGEFHWQRSLAGFRAQCSGTAWKHNFQGKITSPSSFQGYFLAHLYSTPHLGGRKLPLFSLGH